MAGLVPGGSSQFSVKPERVTSLLKNMAFDVQPLKGASDFEELTASLKRCPDTKRDFQQMLGVGRFWSY
jgi:hypothetical protein